MEDAPTLVKEYELTKFAAELVRFHFPFKEHFVIDLSPAYQRERRAYHACLLNPF